MYRASDGMHHLIFGDTSGSVHLCGMVATESLHYLYIVILSMRKRTRPITVHMPVFSGKDMLRVPNSCRFLVAQ